MSAYHTLVAARVETGFAELDWSIAGAGLARCNSQAGCERRG